MKFRAAAVVRRSTVPVVAVLPATVPAVSVSLSSITASDAVAFAVPRVTLSVSCFSGAAMMAIIVVRRRAR